MAGELGLGFKKVLCKLEGSKESVGFTVSLSHSISDRKQIVWQFIRSFLRSASPPTRRHRTSSFRFARINPHGRPSNRTINRITGNGQLIFRARD